MTADGEPFFLSCREAGWLLRVSRETANGYLRMLAEDGILELVRPANWQHRRAAEYRYLGR